MRPTPNSVEAALPASGCRAHGGVGRVTDGPAVAVQGRGAGDDHEEPDHAGQDRAGDTSTRSSARSSVRSFLSTA